MSQEHAQAFLERMRSDDTFIETLIRIEDAETKMNFIQSQGYEFTADELETAPPKAHLPHFYKYNIANRKSDGQMLRPPRISGGLWT